MKDSKHLFYEDSKSAKTATTVAALIGGVGTICTGTGIILTLIRKQEGWQNDYKYYMINFIGCILLLAFFLYIRFSKKMRFYLGITEDELYTNVKFHGKNEISTSEIGKYEIIKTTKFYTRFIVNLKNGQKIMIATRRPVDLKKTFDYLIERNEKQEKNNEVESK